MNSTAVYMLQPQMTRVPKILLLSLLLQVQVHHLSDISNQTMCIPSITERTGLAAIVEMIDSGRSNLQRRHVGFRLVPLAIIIPCFISHHVHKMNHRHASLSETARRSAFLNKSSQLLPSTRPQSRQKCIAFVLSSELFGT